MSAIKLHLEMAEFDALERYADSLHVTSEDVVYCALNRLLLQGRDPDIHEDILNTRIWRRDNLPLWSDSASSVHAYEAKHDQEPSPSRYL